MCVILWSINRLKYHFIWNICITYKFVAVQCAVINVFPTSHSILIKTIIFQRINILVDKYLITYLVIEWNNPWTYIHSWTKEKSSTRLFSCVKGLVYARLTLTHITKKRIFYFLQISSIQTKSYYENVWFGAIHNQNLSIEHDYWSLALKLPTENPILIR